MNSQVLEPRLLSDTAPHPVDVGEGLAGELAADDVGIVVQARNDFQPGDCGAAQWCENGFAVLGLPDIKRLVVPIDVRPLGGEDFIAPDAG